MTVNYPAILRELQLAGYVGAHLYAAFERMCVAIGGHADVAPVAAAPTSRPKVARRARAALPGQRELQLMGIVAGTDRDKPLARTPAERQADRRARLRNVTQRDKSSAQPIEIVEESRNVTTNRDSFAQATDFVAVSDESHENTVTRRGKKRSPHTPLRKTTSPKSPLVREFVTVPWDNPLIPFIESICGKLKARYGQGYTVRAPDLDAAKALMAEKATAPPFKATG